MFTIINVVNYLFQDIKFWRNQFEILLTEVKEKQKEEKKNADPKKEGKDKETPKGNDRVPPHAAAGKN